MQEIPATLGICRACGKLQILTTRSLDDTTSATIYYCKATRHSTYGCAQCRMFISKVSP